MHLQRTLGPVPDRVVHSFPIFPLGLVALPTEIVPLHIFEPRYRTMISECLEQQREFGIVWAGEDAVRSIGCAVEITNVLDTLPDGRMNIITQGTRPFRVVEEQHDQPYPAATIEWLDDEPESPSEPVADAAHDVYRELVEQATDTEPDPEQLSEMSAYGMAATVDFGLDAKQGLLDLRSENARLTLVTRLLRAALKRLSFIDRAQAKARSNGKVHFG
jgi:Lon protease-like protein